MYDSLNQINQIVTLMLVGVIWTIQLAHYPSFHHVEPEKFAEFERFHTIRISIIVIPLMLCEITVSGLLVHLSGYGLKSIIPFAMVLSVWLTTAVLSVPCHKKLEQGKDTKTITRLVNTNWIRTVLWTAKGILLFTW